MQHPADGRRHFLHRLHAVDGLHEALGLVVADERPGQLAVDVEPVAHDLDIVVGARRSTTGRGRFPGAVDDAVHQDVGIGRDLDYPIQLHALLLEHGVQRLCLRDGARETVEDEAGLAVLGVEALGDDSVHNLVGDEIAAVHDFLGRKAHRGLLGNGRAQDIAGRELRDAVGLDKDLGLRALARARRAQEYDSHRRLPPSRERLTSPSYCWAMRWLWIWLTVSKVTVTMMSSDVPPMNWLTASWLKNT